MPRPLPSDAVPAHVLHGQAARVLLQCLAAGEDLPTSLKIWRSIPQDGKYAIRERQDAARIHAFLGQNLGLTGAWPAKIQDFREALERIVRYAGIDDDRLTPQELEDLATADPEPEPERQAPISRFKAGTFGDNLPDGALEPLRRSGNAENGSPRRDRRTRSGGGGSNPFERPEGVQEALRGLDPSKLDELSDLEQLRRVRKAIFAQLVISPGSSFRGLMFSLDQINKQIQQLEQEGGDNVDLERNPVACAVAILEELEAALVLLGVPAYRAKDLASECREAARVAERAPLPPAPAPSGDPSAPPYAPPGYGEDLPEEDSGEGW